MALNVGDAAPDFVLTSGDGETVRLKDFKGKQAVVLYFYPKDDTPGCTTEACQFRDLNKEIAKAGAAVLGVSRDSEASHAKFAKKFDLTFPLLSDPEQETIDKYGAWGERSMYGKKFMGVLRTTVLIDKKGKVARVWEKVKVPGHGEAVLAAVRELG